MVALLASGLKVAMPAVTGTLSAGMAQCTGLHANWCTFATWASKQAGQTIRKEDLRRFLESALEGKTSNAQAASELQAETQRLGARRLGPQRVGINLSLDEFAQLAWKAYDPESAFDRSSAAVARGNLKVFAEIAREFIVTR